MLEEKTQASGEKWLASWPGNWVTTSTIEDQGTRSFNDEDELLLSNTGLLAGLEREGPPVMPSRFLYMKRAHVSWDARLCAFAQLLETKAPSNSFVFTCASSCLEHTHWIVVYYNSSMGGKKIENCENSVSVKRKRKRHGQEVSVSTSQLSLFPTCGALWGSEACARGWVSWFGRPLACQLGPLRWSTLQHSRHL